MPRERSEPVEPASVDLRLDGEVVGMWFEMQGRLQAHFTALATEYGLSAVPAKVLLQLQLEGAMTMRTWLTTCSTTRRI